MTAAPTAAAPTIAGGARTGFARLLLAEWTKLRSVRSTVWSLSLLVALFIGSAVMLSSLTVSHWASTAAPQRAAVLADPAGTLLNGGLQFGQLTICVLGAIVIASEYGTGLIHASVLAVPRRLPMLAAKSVVFTALVFALGTLVSLVSFLLGAPILHGKAPTSLGDPQVLRAVLGGGLYLAMLGLFAIAVGTILRYTAAAITTVLGVVLMLPPVTGLLPGSLGVHARAYLPTEAGRLIAQAHRSTRDVLSPWQGYGVFAAWTVLLLIIAAVLLKRRDA